MTNGSAGFAYILGVGLDTGAEAGAGEVDAVEEEAAFPAPTSLAYAAWAAYFMYVTAISWH